MILKAFDYDDMLYENGKGITSKYKEMKKKLNPHVLHFIKDDYIGICVQDEIENIVNILKEYGNVNTIGNFLNVDVFFNSDDYDWDNIYIGNIEIEGSNVWEEFGKLVAINEKELSKISKKEFRLLWDKLQKDALKIVLDKEIEKMRKDLEDTIKTAKQEFKKRKSIMYK